MDTITFEQMQQYEHDENVLIIDVREPDEIKNTGLIGYSINIPCKFTYIPTILVF